ncbi:MAG TPA: SIMPL domain-containing protein [Propionibacteriaceae bacterium]|jgi:uncharacterized protein|nr:SIMPL domain-containing protein [Propionibacteriaceae bacterium]
MTTPIVTVRGEAQLEVPPDFATLAFTVHSTGDSAETPRSELAKASARIGDLLAEHAAAIERSSTSGLHVAPIFSRRSGTKVTGYRGSFSTQIVVHDFDALSALVFTLTRLPNSQIDGPWWSLRRDNAAFRTVRLDAIADARHRADDYAAAFGALVADLVEVSDLETGFPAGREMRTFAMAKDMAEAAAFEFEPATQTVSGQVTVRFAITTPDLKPVSGQ